MRMVGLIGLIAAVAVVGFLMKKQLSTLQTPQMQPTAAASDDHGSGDTIREQSVRIQQQYKNALEDALHQGRDRLEQVE